MTDVSKAEQTVRDLCAEMFPGESFESVMADVHVRQLACQTVLAQRAVPKSKAQALAKIEASVIECLMRAHTNGDETGYATNLRVLAKLQEGKLARKVYH